MPKNGPFWRVFRKPEAWGQTVLPDRSGQKLAENAKIQILHFKEFSDNVTSVKVEHYLLGGPAII